jgi:hypothetical protein
LEGRIDSMVEEGGGGGVRKSGMETGYGFCVSNCGAEVIVGGG